MSQVVVTLKIMPTSPDVDMDALTQAASEKVVAFGAEVAKQEQEPIAFGLKALNLYFVMDEEKGSTDALEESLSSLEDVNSVEVTDVRRTVG